MTNVFWHPIPSRNLENEKTFKTNKRTNNERIKETHAPTKEEEKMEMKIDE